MSKFAQDCNKDGVINCDDFARIHVLGGERLDAEEKKTAFNSFSHSIILLYLVFYTLLLYI